MHKKTTENKEKIVAVIPARGGSKGIVGKNVKLLDGKPLIGYAIELARKAARRGLIADHIVSTDCEKIASIAKDFGGSVTFLRPAELATDESPVVETIIHAIDWWQNQQKQKVEHVLLLQPTNPLTDIEDVASAIRYYLANQPDAKCLISVTDAQRVRLPNLYYKKGMYLEQVLKEVDPVVRRQDLRKLYWRNGSIYISRRDLLLREGKILDKNPLFYEMPRERSLPIDNMFDWNLAEILIRSKNG